MFSRRDILSRYSYWLSEIRFDLMRVVGNYMDQHDLKRNELAKHLDCTPGYVSQMLNGDTNVSLEKLCKVSLAVGKVPRITFEDVESAIARDAILNERGFVSSGKISGTLHLTTPEAEQPALRLIRGRVSEGETIIFS